MLMRSSIKDIAKEQSLYLQTFEKYNKQKERTSARLQAVPKV